jgi:hypothetical protein
MSQSCGVTVDVWHGGRRVAVVWRDGGRIVVVVGVVMIVVILECHCHGRGRGCGKVGGMGSGDGEVARATVGCTAMWHMR